MADKVRRRLDSRAFGLLLAYVVLFLFGIWLLVTYIETGRNTQDRQADKRAQQIAAVTACFATVANEPLAKGFIDGQGAIIQNGIDSNKAILDADHLSAKQRQIRLDSLGRLNLAKLNNDELQRFVTQTTPTRKACIQLAVKTHVPYSQFVAKKKPAPKKSTPATGQTEGKP